MEDQFFKFREKTLMQKFFAKRNGPFAKRNDLFGKRNGPNVKRNNLFGKRTVPNPKKEKKK